MKAWHIPIYVVGALVYIGIPWATVVVGEVWWYGDEQALILPFATLCLLTLVLAGATGASAWYWNELNNFVNECRRKWRTDPDYFQRLRKELRKPPPIHSF